MRSLTAWPILLLLAPSLAISQVQPTPVSPGSPDRFETILQICPTFSWTAGESSAGTRSTYGQIVIDETGAPGFRSNSYSFYGPLVEPFHSYWLEARWQPEAAGDSLRFYGCAVTVEYWNIQH